MSHKSQYGPSMTLSDRVADRILSDKAASIAYCPIFYNVTRALCFLNVRINSSKPAPGFDLTGHDS